MGVFGTFKDNIKEFCMDLIPLDNDLLSMENSVIYRVGLKATFDYHAFIKLTRLSKDCFLFDDYTHLFHIAKSIMTLQTLYGIIPNIYGKGKCSRVRLILFDSFFASKKQHMKIGKVYSVRQLMLFRLSDCVWHGAKYETRPIEHRVNEQAVENRQPCASRSKHGPTHAYDDAAHIRRADRWNVRNQI